MTTNSHFFFQHSFFVSPFDCNALFQASCLPSSFSECFTNARSLAYSSFSRRPELICLNSASSAMINNKWLNTNPQCNPTRTRKSSLKVPSNLSWPWAFLCIVYTVLINHFSTPSFLKAHHKTSLGTKLSPNIQMQSTNPSFFLVSTCCVFFLMSTCPELSQLSSECDLLISVPNSFLFLNCYSVGITCSTTIWFTMYVIMSIVSARVFTPPLKLKFPLVAFSPLKYLNIFGVPIINTSPLRVVGKFHKGPLNKLNFDFQRIERNYHL